MKNLAESFDAFGIPFAEDRERPGVDRVVFPCLEARSVTVTPEEVLRHENAMSPNGGSAYDLDDLRRYEWECAKVPVADLYYEDQCGLWVPSMRMWDEATPQSFRRVKSEEDYVSDDEAEARRYAKRAGKIPAILVLDTSNGYEILSGRHRSRAQYLNGESSIPAYVGRKKSMKEDRGFA